LDEVRHVNSSTAGIPYSVAETYVHLLLVITTAGILLAPTDSLILGAHVPLAAVIVSAFILSLLLSNIM
jgi:hypothetical protein